MPMLARHAPVRLAAALSLAVAATGCATAGFVPDRAHGFVESQSAGHRHYVYLPTGWSADRTWPVVVYLHGGGERGSDGVKPTQVGLGPAIQRTNGAFPYVVVFPQCESGVYWAEPSMRARILDSLDATLAEFHGDPSRVYLTGNSMGGFGTFLLAARTPGRFAALVPIAGGVKPPFGVSIPEDDLFKKGPDHDNPEATVARAIGRTPTWIFHGASDWVVSPDNSRRMEALLKPNGGEVRLSMLPGVGHNSEDTAYAMPELWRWLGEQHL